ncbi:MAG: hypothetical protein CNE98_00140 [Bacteroidetes bacterium MED-G17]|nr:MAG: hypothetical protein CNE98_00140 [Bacteroidetes bacterium MED-G17]CAI8359569.1 MAG: Bifunctional protein PyrR [Bacteroidetes bacterium MED-G17]|tara:strand:- start:8313 stop:8813 length:501 start_codon:yes stop_codon:yes gene_type:complete
MEQEQITILTHESIQRKLLRMAWEIYEELHEAEEICFVGIEGTGESIAKQVRQNFLNISDIPSSYYLIQMDKSQAQNATLDADLKRLENAHIVLVDDVLNSGKTMFYALSCLKNPSIQSITTVVLANRDHKKFPVEANIVGISLATTRIETIYFVEENGKMKVNLQ